VSASKFTAEARGALLERIAAGVSMRDAARAVGIREKTVKGWLTRGRREETGDYADFAAAVEEVRAAAKERAEPMDGDELAQVVSGMARAGSVQAAKLRWEMLRAPGEAEEKAEADPLAEVDELARRRRAR
jgi:transposase